MTDTASCDQCGTKFRPIAALKELCPVCLFSRATSEDAEASKAPPGVRSMPSPWIPPKTSELAPQFEHLEILELVGRGGMSAVYKARHKNLDRIVALKILPQEMAASKGGVERFQREAQMLAKLEHPNIVGVYDAGQAGNWCYLVMEYVEGMSLRQLLGQQRLPVGQVLGLLPALCDALQYAHDREIVHRDIKPENILLDKSGRVKVVDFGLAKLLAGPVRVDRVTGTQQIVGTPHYLAPEQLEPSATVDHRADIYSLGVFMYEALTGELPVGHFAPPSAKAGSDTRLDGVVLKALAADPDERYQQVRYIADQLALLGENSPRTGGTAWHAVRSHASELILSVVSVSAALIGGGFLSKVPRFYGSGRIQLISGAAVWLLGSFLVARVNTASVHHWRGLSPFQTLCVPVLVLGYAAIGTAILLGPGLAVFALGGLPLVVDVEYWQAFGELFGERERSSMLTGYWLRTYGLSAIVTALWALTLAGICRWRPRAVRVLFHPMGEAGANATAAILALSGVGVLLPIGCALLYASRSGTW